MGIAPTISVNMDLHHTSQLTPFNVVVPNMYGIAFSMSR